MRAEGVRQAILVDLLLLHGVRRADVLESIPANGGGRGWSETCAAAEKTQLNRRPQRLGCPWYTFLEILLEI